MYALVTDYRSYNYNRLKRNLSDIEYIVIHWWNSPSAGPTFEGVCKYLCRIGGDSSAHDVVTAGRVAPIIPLDRVAWHAGGTANPKSIGMELNPWLTDAVYETASQRIADHWETLGRRVPLKPHRQFMNTSCPGPADLDRLYKRASEIYFGVSRPVPDPSPTDDWFDLLMSEMPVLDIKALPAGVFNRDVARFQGLLQAVGIYTAYRQDGLPGEATERACAVAERRYHAGIGADGRTPHYKVGRKLWTSLMTSKVW